MPAKERIISSIGWVGAVLILLSYALLSFNYISAQSIIYHALSGLGALGIITVAWHKKDYAPMELNLAFALIALISIIILITKS